MPVQDKSGKEQVTFALAVVKASVISNREESLRIQAALRVILPGVSVILVAEDEQNELSSYRHRQALAEFAKDAPCQVITSSRICAN
jgi:hypothetical protein